MNDCSGMVLMGGSFDPVHNAHLSIAREVAASRGFERITLIPAACSPHKDTTHASAKDRLAMLRLAVGGDELFDICDIEFQRQGCSYTYDTVMELRSLHPAVGRLYWLLGADTLEDLAKWYRLGDLLEEVELVIAVRPPWHERLDAMWEQLRGQLSEQIVDRLKASVVETSLIEVASSDIRARVVAGQDISHMVPAPVAEYIRSHGLYGADKG